MSLLPPSQCAELEEALYFLHVAELKEVIKVLGHEASSNTKLDLINQILCFFKTGVVLEAKQIPVKSKVRKGLVCVPAPHELMLKGAYKNDLVNRTFFKLLIGSHFHFTAFGIDWLNERWQAGNPPTYQEFANMWQDEYARRKISKPAPKDEWAYINFVQNMMKLRPGSSKAFIDQAWKSERKRQYMIVFSIIKAYINRVSV